MSTIFAFYSIPTGKKVLAEMPQTMAESMQAMRPVMLEHIDSIKQNVDQQLAELEKEYKVGQAKKAEPVSN
jgi:hypothetical protein